MGETACCEIGVEGGVVAVVKRKDPEGVVEKRKGFLFFSLEEAGVMSCW